MLSCPTVRDARRISAPAAKLGIQDGTPGARSPLVAPPYDVTWVRAPSSIASVPRGKVWIEHWATTGHDEHIERPVAEAVPLFWRVMIEKFGVDPNA